MVNLIFKEKDDVVRSIGYSSVSYSSNDDEEMVVETTEDELSSIFGEADVDEVAGGDEPIEAAIEDALAYRDYLILEDGEIVFDETYAREVEE